MSPMLSKKSQSKHYQAPAKTTRQRHLPNTVEINIAKPGHALFEQKSNKPSLLKVDFYFIQRSLNNS